MARADAPKHAAVLLAQRRGFWPRSPPDQALTPASAAAAAASGPGQVEARLGRGPAAQHPPPRRRKQSASSPTPASRWSATAQEAARRDARVPLDETIARFEADKAEAETALEEAARADAAAAPDTDDLGSLLQAAAPRRTGAQTAASAARPSTWNAASARAANAGWRRWIATPAAGPPLGDRRPADRGPGGKSARPRRSRDGLARGRRARWKTAATT